MLIHEGILLLICIGCISIGFSLSLLFLNRKKEIPVVVEVINKVYYDDEDVVEETSNGGASSDMRPHHLHRVTNYIGRKKSNS